MGKSPWTTRPAAKAPAKKFPWAIVVSIVVLVALTVGAIAWWLYAYPPEDPQVAKVKALQAQLFQSPQADRAAAGGPTTRTVSTTAQPALTPKQREAAMTQLRAEMEKLTEEQRDQVRESMGDSFRERMRATIKAYRAMPEEKRAAYLDKQIDEMEERRAEFQRRRSDGGSGGAGGSGPGGRGGAGGRTGGSSGSGDRAPSTERRLDRRRQMLAGTSPEERAEAEMFFSDLNARREERGLEAFGPGGRR